MVSVAVRPASELVLDDRYTATAGRALLTGTQALVRLLLEQRRLDARRGLDTGVFVSGYPGSPLGGLDQAIGRAHEHLAPAGIVHVPAVNEELAATAIAGTQLVAELPGVRRAGVVGFWYGKAPGLDRAADAIRHGNLSGTAHLGGAVALVGEDPLCKSSTVPSSCELMCESLVMPMLAPASVQDVVRLGLHAVAMSRHAGLWTALRIAPDIADAAATVDLDVGDEIPLPPDSGRGSPPLLLGASSVAAEGDLLGARLERAREYGRDARLNRIVFEPRRPVTALIAGGPAFATLRRALEQLGLNDAGLETLGIRLVRLDAPWPLHRDDIDRFVEGVGDVIVVEHKRAFVETQVRDALYAKPDRPMVVGKRDERGDVLVPVEGAVDADVLARALTNRWQDRLPAPSRSHLAVLASPATTGGQPLAPPRTPFFCSGCPHNLSTRSPSDQLVGAGIGCHAMVALDPAGTRGRILGAPQMGGEGAQWIGMAPFTSDEHYVQNLGDGTFHHSGSLAIRAAVAAKVNITFRLLYNDAVAMTGGQTPAGRMDVEAMAHWLAIEGVRRVIITTEDPQATVGPLPEIAEVRHRDELGSSMAELAGIEGVTVLLHTDRCATEERRLRKRGKLETPAERVWINERVCEGCGDCGQASSCLSVVPVETDFGRKTQIHQSSCTQDFACVEGDCPSFVLVTPRDPGGRSARRPDLPVELPEPALLIDPARSLLVRMPGIGGTGVVTASQILQMAALIEGRWASGLDQTGLAQKGGPVISDVRIAPAATDAALRAATGEVDVLLGLDLLGAATPETLRMLDPERTVAVVNRHVTATASMVTDPDVQVQAPDRIIAAITRSTVAENALFIDAGEIAQRLFADHMPTNVLMLGVAFQHGCLPVGAQALEEAIRINGAGVETNLAAFRWGRAVVVDADAVARALSGPDREPTISAPAVDASTRKALDDGGVEGPLRALLESRAADLRAYQSADYAARYLADVLEVLSQERELCGTTQTPVTEAYARGMHKLMAYKDEYEVARLHLDSFERAKRDGAFGPDARVQVLLHPPVLRALGLKRKLRVGRGARPLFGVLRAARRVRGTPVDPFGHASLRRLERALIAEHRDLVREAMAHLTPETAAQVAEIAALADLVRGYEDIKLANIERYRETARALLPELARV